eukprot:TRINITY_DN13938_c0_g1_i1.p1 TRINITY_DN13938_c0_g1~~TRINITY_DN13938_c0_g1_i1.p1  ORF type:complete len:381 (+),score=100.21 TRINITY_DN13938_c0_g1_i1:62-1204(+)
MAPKAQGKKVDCPGLPDGWECVEKAYLSGQHAGKTYQRFQSGKHANVLSLKAAIKLDAEDRGLDAEEAVRQYELRKQAAKDEELKAKEDSGILKGEKRELYIQKFRALHGELNGAIISSLPGWRGESKLLESCGQISAQYVAPNGQIFKLVKDIEAKFAMDIEKGRPVPDFAAARASCTDEFGRAVNTARLNVLAADQITKSDLGRKRRRYLSSADYAENPALKIVKLEPKLTQKTVSSDLDTFGMAKAEVKAFVDNCAKLRKELVLKGFEEDIDLVYVARAAGATSSRKTLDALRGVYYRRPGECHDKAYYQRVELTGGRLWCTGMHISWSSNMECWKIGSLVLAGIAICKSPTEQPYEVDKNWSIYELKAEAINPTSE